MTTSLSSVVLITDSGNLPTTFVVDNIGTYGVGQRIRFNALDDRFYDTISNTIAFVSTNQSPIRVSDNPFALSNVGSIYLNSTACKLTTAIMSSLNTTAPWKFECWIYVSQIIPGFVAVVNHTSFQIYLKTTNHSCYFVMSGTDTSASAGADAWTTNRWTHLELSQNSSGDATLVIDDGVTVTTVSAAGLAIPTSTSTRISDIGYFTGMIHGVKFYNVNETAKFIAATDPVEEIQLFGSTSPDQYIAYVEGFITAVSNSSTKSITLSIDTVRGVPVSSQTTHKSWVASPAIPAYTRSVYTGGTDYVPGYTGQIYTPGPLVYEVVEQETIFNDVFASLIDAETGELSSQVKSINVADTQLMSNVHVDYGWSGTKQLIAFVDDFVRLTERMSEQAAQIYTISSDY